MQGQRERVLDAAVGVVAAEGVRALEHEAVDAAAGLAAGVTRSLFPTREDLVVAVADRCIEREMAMVAGPAGEVAPSPDDVATAFGGFVRRALGEDRVVTLARYALQADAAMTPARRGHYAVGAGQVNDWATDLLRRAGSPHPERDLGIVANYVTGLVFHELALPTPGLDPSARVRDLIDALGWAAP